MAVLAHCMLFLVALPSKSGYNGYQNVPGEKYEPGDFPPKLTRK